MLLQTLPKGRDGPIVFYSTQTSVFVYFVMCIQANIYYTELVISFYYHYRKEKRPLKIKI